MKLYEITFSPTGGTKKVADILSPDLADEILEIDLCDRTIDFSKFILDKEALALIAVPSYGGRIPQTAIDRLSVISGQQTKAILVCVYGNRAYDNTLAQLLDISYKAGFRPVAAVAALAEHSIARKVAAGRPDAEDEKRLKEMAGQIRQKIGSSSFRPATRICSPTSRSCSEALHTSFPASVSQIYFRRLSSFGTKPSTSPFCLSFINSPHFRKNMLY